MKEFTITPAESGQKCIKYCVKLLPDAGSGFLYKMLRKKNITLNGRKADGTEILKEKDVLRFFFSDETFQKFSGKNSKTDSSLAKPVSEIKKSAFTFRKERIIYEDDNILLYNKPAGLLSQKSAPQDISLNELFLAYLEEKQDKSVARQLLSSETSVSKPSICNRLDRNTSGMVICGKTYLGLRTMNTLIARREIGKYYHCIVAGKVTSPILLNGYLKKDEKTNKVAIKKQAFEGASYIETEIIPVKAGRNATLLEVHLITGKTHQIRSHLAFLGHPIIGDHKYGNADINQKYKQKYGLKYQLLHAYRLVFPDMSEEESRSFVQVSQKEFLAPKPELFICIEKEEIHDHVEF